MDRRINDIEEVWYRREPGNVVALLDPVVHWDQSRMSWYDALGFYYYDFSGRRTLLPAHRVVLVREFPSEHGR